MKDPGHAAQKPALRFLTSKMGTILSETRSCAEDKHVILRRTDILSGVQGMTKKIQTVISNFSFIQYKSKGAGLWSTSQRRGQGAAWTADGESKQYLHTQSWVWLVGKKIWVLTYWVSKLSWAELHETLWGPPAPSVSQKCFSDHRPLSEQDVYSESTPAGCSSTHICTTALIQKTALGRLWSEIA